MNKSIVDIIIPAFNEAPSIQKVIKDIPKERVRHIIVCDNNSTDETADRAKEAGAVVVFAKKKGYGYACLQGLKYIEALEIKPDIVGFIDGDYSDFPEKLGELLDPIVQSDVDMVIGSRALGNLEKGSMTIPQRFGNWLSTTLIRWLYKYTFTDLGPFRTIRYDKLLALNMRDEDFGWTVEMQVKAAKARMVCTEIPVPYRKRIGQSKVSGTIKGTIMAGYKILWTIFKLL